MKKHTASIALILTTLALFGGEIVDPHRPAEVERRADEFAAYVVGEHPRGDVNGDGRVDGLDVQSYVRLALTPEPWTPEWIAGLRAHPDFPAVMARLAAQLAGPASDFTRSPEAMLGTLYACAQWEAFTGEWPRPADTLPILRMVRDGWPLPFANFDHQLTLWHIPTMHRAAKLSKRVRDAFDIPFRWIESRMLEPQLPFKAPTAIYSTSPGSGLRDMVMIRELLYGEGSARDVALRGYGNDPTQWGLPDFIDKIIDDHGLLRVNVGAFNHWTWTNRVALVWLLEVKGYKWYLTDAQREKWRKFYELPCRMLAVGGQTVTMPKANDDYQDHPVVGPRDAWVHPESELDKWALWHARRQSSPSFSWLLVPADDPGYSPPERPPGCSGNRNYGRVMIEEPDDGTLTRFKYLGDGETIIMGGHRLGRAVTVEVRR